MHRRKGQTLVNIIVSGDFLAALDAAAHRDANGNRSEYLRLAVTERLRRLGYTVPGSPQTIPTGA